MAAFQTPRDNSTSPPNNADFQTPLWLRSLNTPTSTSSIQSSPSDLTPPIAAFPNLALSSPIKPIPTATMDDFEDSPEYDNTDFADNTDATAPLPDLHSKLEDATPRYSRTNAYNSLTHAISSAKMLHQVLGIQPPEPYQRPPEMPNTLGQRFAASLVEYGLDREMQGLGLQRNTGPMKEVSVGAALGKAVLEDIREEKESPVKATHQGAGLDGRPVGLMNKAPVWHTERETTTGCHASVSKEGLRTNGNLNNQNGHQLNVLPRERPATAHSTENRSTGSGSSETLVEHSMSSTRHDPASAKQQHPTIHTTASDLGPNELSQRVSSVPPVLFPSPRVDQAECWDFVQKPNRSIAPPGFVPGGFAPVPAIEPQIPFTMPFRTQLQNMPSVPHIAVQSPSPKKPRSKKRSANSQHKIGPVHAKNRTADDAAGLPVLAANQEAKWKFKFPGNTYALLTIMLPWSIKMQSFSKRLPSPYHFSMNAAFPHPISPPIWRKLVSVAFYDTSVTPHKEVRFLGPGDVAEISYNEVDVFSYPTTDTVIDADQAAHDSKVSAIKRALGLIPGQTTKELKDSQRAANGEGRWAYILIQGHKTKEAGATAPHVLIAWHISAVTSTSECLHTIYPDNHVPPKPKAKPPSRAPQRFSSLQNLAARYSESQGLHRGLRSASSSELLDLDLAIPVDDGAVTFMRKVWKMEKAGRIPLIEGYRVDVQKWCGWLDAVGMGKGKVIVWEEKE